MQNSTMVVADPAWLDNLEYCLCGDRVLNRSSVNHEGCIISGVARKFFSDIGGWREYIKENGQRIAEIYRNK